MNIGAAVLAGMIWAALGAGACAQPPPVELMIRPETAAAHDARLAWWREARFGLFIHWGLYAIPAGEWGDRTDYGEWIRDTAQIPNEEYEQLVGRFNPVKFDAAAWVQAAKDAGMKYIVITSKHHDGFCLFDSQYTDFDIRSTPFQRDVLKELAEACSHAGIRLCFYHSIMDWHHPDWLPRRAGEQRSAAGADFERYVVYMKNQLRELCTNYGPLGVLWFDGEWEDSWTHELGVDLYNYVRDLRPEIIINNRVDVGREGLGGMTRAPHYAGDFGTPEQEIPATGSPGVDWETCLTMNDHWGYNKRDNNWKSSSDLVRKLVDIASKGGNFLLNIGPTAEGEFPPPCQDRLRDIGAWLKTNGEAIYGTQASPFKALAWGRCTQKTRGGGTTRLYLHVFDWPQNGQLVVSGLCNDVVAARMLSAVTAPALEVSRADGALVVHVPPQPPDPFVSAVALDIAGTPEVVEPPDIGAAFDSFVDTLEVTISSKSENVELRYTTDGSEPKSDSQLVRGGVSLADTTTVKARAYRDGQPVSGRSAATFTKLTPRSAEHPEGPLRGLRYEYYEGDWDRLPDLDHLELVKTGSVANLDLSPRRQSDHFAFRYLGFIEAPRTGVYRFLLRSDDGSRLYIGERLLLDNDGLHGAVRGADTMALEAGLHALTVTFFEKTGAETLDISWAGPGFAQQKVPDAALRRVRSPDDKPIEESAVLIPEPRQLTWQELEFTAFAHFGINTFTNREWGEGQEDPRLFNPTQFDARQWVRAFKAAGMRQMILTAKHHDGFCLWPSKYTEHSVKSSPWRGGQGDVVREVADACREAGLKFGLYLSPWDRHEPSYGDTPRYNEFYENQLTELLTNYGPVHEVWFDGACGAGPSGKKQVYDWNAYLALVRRLQPEAVIFSDAGPDVRWVGNEAGFAGETNWSMLRRAEFYPGTPEYGPLTCGHEDGTHWVPAECDVSIRPGWFHHADQDGAVKTLVELLDIYYRSVGRNAVLLLNVPPDQRGLIHENDVARLAELRAVLDETFRVNLAAGKPVLAGAAGGSAEPVTVLTDGDSHTAWQAPAGARRVSMTVDLGTPTTFDRISLQEDIRHGQRVRAFTVEAWNGTAWNKLVEGTTVGYKRLLRIPSVEATQVRWTIEDARAAPWLAEFGVFRASPRETQP
jgi:alpha-L-fucosidase